MRCGEAVRPQAVGRVDAKETRLVYFVPPNNSETGDLVLSLDDGSYVVAASIKPTQDDAGFGQNRQLSFAPRVERIEPTGPRECQLRFAEFPRATKYQFVGIDKDGTEHSPNACFNGQGVVAVTFGCEKEDLSTVELRYRTPFEVRFNGIALRAGIYTHVTTLGDTMPSE